MAALCGRWQFTTKERARRNTHDAAEFVGIPLDTVREMMIGNGMDPAAVEMSITGMRRAIAGDYAVLTGDVARILGRAPLSFETWARECLTSLVA